MTLCLLLAVARRFRLPCQNRRVPLILGMVVAALILLPVRGLPMGRWLGALNFQASVPLMGLLAGCLWQMTAQRELFRPHELRTAWGFGLVSGIVLYPSALGMGDFDLYQWGWGFSPLLAGVVLTAMVLAARGNRFCWLLIMAMLAWDARCFETTNLWDYLVDPVFVLASVAIVIRTCVNRYSGNCIS
jgi:hypothetical protein